MDTTKSQLKIIRLNYSLKLNILVQTFPKAIKMSFKTDLLLTVSVPVPFNQNAQKMDYGPYN